MAAERTLDVFWLLGELDRKNFNVWDQLTEDQRKEVSPYVLLRWLAGCNEPEQLVMLSEHANTSLFEHGADKKELMLMLFAACTSGGPKRYKWLNPKGAVKASSKAIELIMKTYGMSAAHATDVRPLFSAQEIMELGEFHGMQKDELKDLQKELAK